MFEDTHVDSSTITSAILQPWLLDSVIHDQPIVHVVAFITIFIFCYNLNKLQSLLNFRFFRLFKFGWIRGYGERGAVIRKLSY